MGSPQNTGCFFPMDSIEPAIPYFSHPDSYPERVASALEVDNLWGYTQCNWDPDMFVYPPYGGPATEPPFAGNPQVLQTLPQPQFSEVFPQPSRENPNEPAPLPFDGHAADVHIGVEPGATEYQTPAKSARRRSKDPAKRRDLNRRQTALLAELRGVVGVEGKTPTLTVLHEAIERLGGTVPQGDHNRQRGIGLAYHKLHVLTGSQGELVRERCLQRVIGVLNGQPVLHPVFEGMGST